VDIRYIYKSGRTTAEVAKELGVAKTTLLRWLRDGWLKEPRRVLVNGATWRVWTNADLTRARKLKASLRRGPKPKKT